MCLKRVIVSVTDLQKDRDGGRDSQLVFGEDFTVEKTEGEFTYGRTACGYRGWVAAAALGVTAVPTHRVNAMGSYIYAAPDMKSATTLRLPFGAQVCVRGEVAGFSQIDTGYVYMQHLSTEPAADFVAQAERFLGVPYLWGGRSSSGLDCSALVQVALLAYGIAAPRDSHMQESDLGRALDLDQPLIRGDLVFWKGHVGIMRDDKTLLHANAYHMTVASELLETAVTRIINTGDGAITTTRRPG